MDFLDIRHRTRQLVGLLRIRLGWLVVLGPGRKCIIHALACRHGTDSLTLRNRKTRAFQIMDRSSCNAGVFTESDRCVFGALRRFDFSPYICNRSAPRYFFVVVDRPGNRKFTGNLWLSGRQYTIYRNLHDCFAGSRHFAQQRFSGYCSSDDSAGYTVSAVSGCAGTGQGISRTAVFQFCVYPVDDAACGVGRSRRLESLEAGQVQPALQRVVAVFGVKHRSRTGTAAAGGRPLSMAGRGGVVSGPVDDTFHNFWVV